LSQQFKFDILDLSGGLSDGLPSSHIKDNQLARLTNFYVFGPELRMRGGTHKITAKADSDTGRHLSVFYYKDSLDEGHIIMGDASGFTSYDETTDTLTQLVTSSPVGLGDMPWHFRQWNDTVYAVREEGGRLWRGDHSHFEHAGIPAPDTAPVLSTGAAGSILAGDYYGLVVYKNSTTALRSNIGVLSALYTAPGGAKIVWSSIPVSPTTQVTARELYRTPRNQVGQYYLVATIEDNISTTYTEDNALTDDFGAQADTDLDEPPTNVHLMEVWNGRMWLSDGDLLYWSASGYSEAFRLQDYHPVAEERDGAEITAIHRLSESRLLIGRTNGVWYTVSSPTGNFTFRVMEDKRGVRSPHSMKSAQGMVFWYDGQDFCKSDGGPAQVIGTPKIKTILDEIPDSMRHKVVAAIYPDLSWYVACVPRPFGEYSQIEEVTVNLDRYQLLIYNYAQDSWSVFDYDIEPTFIADFIVDGRRVLWAIFRRHESLGVPVEGDYYGLYEVMAPGYYFDEWRAAVDNGIVVDDEGEIAWEFITKALDGGRPGLMLIPRAVGILTNDIEMSGQATLSYYRNGNLSNDVAARSIDLAAPSDSDGWKWYSLGSGSDGSARSPAHLIQIGLAGTGRSSKSIRGLCITGIALERQGRVR
jgi:hypothetical protein